MLGYLLRDERGAVTVNLVGLSTGLIILSLVVVYVVMDAASHLAEALEAINAQSDASQQLAFEHGKRISMNY